MRRGVIEIDCPADPLPSSDEGSFRDRLQVITDNKSVDLSVRTQNIDQPFIKRDASLSGFALGISMNRPVIVEGNHLLHGNNHKIRLLSLFRNLLVVE